LNYKLEFANGATCDVMSSYERSGNTFRAEAERGWFELNPAFSYRGLKGATSKGPLSYPPLRQQAKHMDAIAKSLIDGTTLPTPGELGRTDMTVIEAIYAAAKSGKRERVKA
jgi:glucose-fructose oxidoreductase